MQAISPFRKLMWKTRASAAIAALAVIVACFSFVPTVRAQQSAEEITSLLTAGPWHTTGGSRRAAVVIFNADGSFTNGSIGPDGTFIDNHLDGARWTITDKAVVTTFKRYVLTIALPLKQGGTQAVNQDGGVQTMSRIYGTNLVPSAAPSAPSAPFGSPEPGNVGPTPSQTGPVSSGAQSDQATVSLLTSGRWHFAGTNAAGQEWSNDRIFNLDGTFLTGTIQPDGSFKRMRVFDGTWVITGDKIVLSYDKHPEMQDTLPLPLDPNGVRGANQAGVTYDVTRVSGGDTAASAASAASNYFGNANGIANSVPSPRQSGSAPGALPANTPAAQPPSIPAELQERINRVREAEAGTSGQPSPGAGFDVDCTVVEADLMSVSVSVGRAGGADIARTYKITDSTTVTIDRRPAVEGDLKVGMVARIKLGADQMTAVSIDANDQGRR